MHVSMNTRSAIAAGLMILAACATAPRAEASSLTGDYYKISDANPDMNRGIDGFLTGLVQEDLGPGGLPVVTTFGSSYASGSGPIRDVDATTGEIQWWRPTATNGVTYEKTQTDALPLDFPSFYPDGQGGDSPTFRAVHWKGSFDLASPGSVTFSLGSDDDAFVFVDRKLKVDNGGVHGVVYAPNVVTGLTAGSHQVDVFFADRYHTQSSIKFDADVQLTPTAVPEPGSMALLAMGALPLLGLRRRK